MKQFVVTSGVVVFTAGVLIGIWKLFFGSGEEPAGPPTTRWEDKKQRFLLDRFTPDNHIERSELSRSNSLH
jgi:hypothetical protein